MPLMLPSTRWNAWLSSPADTGFLLETPSHAFLDAIEIRPVGPAVGDVRNDGPALIERIATEPRPPVEEAVDLTLF
jgi:putative SOS response-associated peptidase YedK